MSSTIKVMLWNANGVLKRKNELEVVLENENLLTETHLSKNLNLKLQNYTAYITPHPENSSRGGTAVIVKKTLKHHEEDSVSAQEYQSTTVALETSNSNPLLLTALYCSPRNQMKKDAYLDMIQKFKHRRIIGGDFNAKHTAWGSRLTNTKGRELHKALTSAGCCIASTGKPTYWPTDKQKIPDLLDFFILKKISQNLVEVEGNFDFDSDHTPVFLKLLEKPVAVQKNPGLINNLTDWSHFQAMLQNTETESVPLATADDIDDEVWSLTQRIQDAAWSSTPNLCQSSLKIKYPNYIRELVIRKRKLRRKWHQTRSTTENVAFNKENNLLRLEIRKYKNKTFNDRIQGLSADKATDYSLWKAAKNINRPIKHSPPVKINETEWAKTDQQKADTFAMHISNTFTPNEGNDNLPTNENWLDRHKRIPKVTSKEVTDEIRRMKTRKSPGFDLITAEVLRKLPMKCIDKIVHIINRCFQLRYVPIHWKVAEVIMLPKPGKPSHLVSSYRPISLLPALSKLFERLFIKRLSKIIAAKNIIPSHQFGFRKSHSTIDQVHRIVNSIEDALEKKKVCSAIFLDVSQAFDKVWHPGLLHKIQNMLPKKYCELIASYLTMRFFRIKQESCYSSLHQINAGVPQGSILGPLLYLLYTSDLPVQGEQVTATFADDTALLAIADTTEAASETLQAAVDSVVRWANKWRIKLNSSKSVHVDFSLKNSNHTPVLIGEVPIPHSNQAKYLGLTLDAKLGWKEHIMINREELELRYRKMYYLLGRNSTLSTHNKLLLYNQILKPIWAYGSQLWGCASKTNIETIQRFQNKVLRGIVNAPWYIRNDDLHRDLKIETVASAINKNAVSHTKRLTQHVNEEAARLLNTAGIERRLKRKKPDDLARL